MSIINFQLRYYRDVTLNESLYEVSIVRGRSEHVARKFENGQHQM